MLPFSTYKSWFFAYLSAIALSVHFLQGQDISYPVSKVSFHYGLKAEGLPDFNELSQATVTLGED